MRIKYFAGLSIITMLCLLVFISCNNRVSLNKEQKAALIFLKPLLNNTDSITNIEISNFMSCPEDTIWALFNDHQYDLMRKRESEIFNELIDERYKMREYDYNSDRHRWNIERLQDEQNQLKEDMSEYEKYFSPPIIHNVAIVRYKTKMKPYWNYINLEFDYSHNKVIREIRNKNIITYEFVLEQGKKGMRIVDFNDTIIEPSYDDILRTTRSTYSCFSLYKEGKYGVFDVSLGLVLPATYDSIVVDWRNKPFYYVNNNNKWGVCDDNGMSIIPAEYDGIMFCLDNDHYFDKDAYNYIVFFVKEGGSFHGIWRAPLENKILEDGMWGVYKITGEQIYPCNNKFRDIPTIK